MSSTIDPLPVLDQCKGRWNGSSLGTPSKTQAVRNLIIWNMWFSRSPHPLWTARSGEKPRRSKSIQGSSLEMAYYFCSYLPVTCLHKEQSVCRAVKLTGTQFYNIQEGAEVFGGQLSILTTVLYIARNSTECKHLSLKLESCKFRICLRVPLSLVYGQRVDAS